MYKKEIKIICLIALTTLAIQACKPKKTAVAEAPATPMNAPAGPGTPLVNVNGLGVDDFLKNFEKATLSHDPVQIMQFINKDYKAEQHDKFLAGNTDLFFSDFFSGGQKNADGKPLIDYKKISSLEKIKMNMLPNKDIYVTYKVSAEGFKVNTSWVIMTAIDKDSKINFSLYGKIN